MESLSHQKILVIGGAGFIGTNLVLYLLKNTSWSLVILDDFSTGDRHVLQHMPEHARHRCQLIEGRLENELILSQAMTGVTGVVHLAALTSVVESNQKPLATCELNITGTAKVLEACRQAKVAAVVLASSNAVIGDQPSPCHEKQVPHPISIYGATKLAGEALCQAYAASFHLNAMALRFANVYGPYSQTKEGVIARFYRLIQAGKDLEVFGNGEQTRDFVHAADIAQAIHLSLMRNLPGEIFQIASGTEISLNELLEHIRQVTQKNFHVSYHPARLGEIDKNFSDISKAKKILGFQPKVELRKGLQTTWENFSA